MSSLKLSKLGCIEGFYGRPWGWKTRRELVPLLAQIGYGVFVYAPKEEHLLRRDWRKSFSVNQLSELKDFAAVCSDSEVEFGVGLSPLEIYGNTSAADWADLRAKIQALQSSGVKRLDILFDDMRGDLPELATRQCEIAHRAAEWMGAGRVNLCPTYYSDDSVLDRIFGARPKDYLETLGRELDPAIGVYWTGEKICSKSFSVEHLARVGAKLQRKPMLWDNYPVNDTPAMCKFLHLRGFTGRPAEIAEYISEHIINPMNQPHLSRIPAETLVMSYAQADAYSAAEAMTEAAKAVLGSELAHELETDLSTFQDGGLDSISPERKREMISKYSRLSHPAADEIIEWLNGNYVVTVEQIRATHGIAPG